MSYGLSYSYNPPMYSLTAHGVTFVGRNLNGSHSLTRDEAQALSSLSVNIVSIFLATSELHGESDAKEAMTLANHVGMSGDRPIYFAAVEMEKSSIEDYLRGTQRALGLHRVGVISEQNTLDWLRLNNSASFYWQYDFSNLNKMNNLERYATSKIGGIDCSEVRSNTKDFGQWQVRADPFPLAKG